MPEVASEKCQGETSTLAPFNLGVTTFSLALARGVPIGWRQAEICSPSPTIQATVLISQLGGSLEKFLCLWRTCICAQCLQS